MSAGMHMALAVSLPVPSLVIIGGNSHAKEMSNKKQAEKGKWNKKFIFGAFLAKRTKNSIFRSLLGS